MNRRRATRIDRPAERGFALLIVLWTLVLMTLVVTQVTASGRLELRLAGNLRGAAVAEAAVDGAVYGAILHLVDGSAQRWAADGATHEIAVAQGRARATVTSEEGKFDLNSASPEVLGAVLRAVGLAAGNADEIALAISGWRFPSGRTEIAAKSYAAAGLAYLPPEEPFQSMSELGLVLGMTPDLVMRLRPHLTIWHHGDPNPVLADPVVRDILRARGPGRALASADARSGEVATIDAEVIFDGGSRARRHAVVRVGAAADHGGWRILEWE